MEQEKIDYILRCALMAPSSKRTNPWEFVVVRDEQKLRAMQGCRTYGSGMFDTAMAAIVVALDTSLSDTWMADGAIAAEHILLAAEEQGLGACWCQVYGRPSAVSIQPSAFSRRMSAVSIQPSDVSIQTAEELIKGLCGIPDDRTVLCVISMGYKAEERQNYDLEKLKYEKIHNETYSCNNCR